MSRKDGKYIKRNMCLIILHFTATSGCTHGNSKCYECTSQNWMTNGTLKSKTNIYNKLKVFY